MSTEQSLVSRRAGMVLLAHGSRDPLWRQPIEAVQQAILAQQPGLPCLCAYLDACTPHAYVRGTGLNARVKRLMLARAFGEGIRRVQFLIDERNKRSQAAVLKLGATKEGVLRAERITWTGHVRDTGVFGLLREEWEQGMPPRV